jgi:thioredoxin 1
MVRETTDATFFNDVIASENPTLVDFWAPWCGPCKVLGPIIEKLSLKSEGKVNVFKLNVDENKETAMRFGITGIPTVIVFRYGQVYKTLVGVQPEQAYSDALAF